jgi:hypothetical protein
MFDEVAENLHVMPPRPRCSIRRCGSGGAAAEHGDGPSSLLGGGARTGEPVTR